MRPLRSIADQLCGLQLLSKSKAVLTGTVRNDPRIVVQFQQLLKSSSGSGSGLSSGAGVRGVVHGRGTSPGGAGCSRTAAESGGAKGGWASRVPCASSINVHLIGRKRSTTRRPTPGLRSLTLTTVVRDHSFCNLAMGCPSHEPSCQPPQGRRLWVQIRRPSTRATPSRPEGHRGGGGKLQATIARGDDARAGVLGGHLCRVRPAPGHTRGPPAVRPQRPYVEPSSRCGRMEGVLFCPIGYTRTVAFHSFISQVRSRMGAWPKR